jgi:hypothetical protein
MTVNELRNIIKELDSSMYYLTSIKAINKAIQDRDEAEVVLGQALKLEGAN